MLYGANETWTKGRRILGSGEDGILTALEVTALDLQNTNLVVLSACSTGLGNVHNTGRYRYQRFNGHILQEFIAKKTRPRHRSP